VSESFAQFVLPNSPRPPVGVSGAFASAPLFNQTVDRSRSIFHLEIRRSLQLHRRIAIGLAFVGLALALIYLLNAWSIGAASSAVEPQAAHSSTGEVSPLKPIAARDPRPEPLRTETSAQYSGHDPRVGRQFQGTSRHQDSPGLPGLVASAVAPWYSADSGVIRNALVLILSFVLLGGAIAVIAHRADPRVYIASEVEQLLGFPPMAQLPDFSEVANEITDEHLLRLASGIDLGFRERGFRRCVFTGTGPEVGVTTVATRLKKRLETMGRTTVLADAAESLNRTEEAQGEMVLVDAAPLADSEETERLVQSAHCTIVVIESGVTTRAQLRTVANTLQRVKAPAVGFVLNRVRLAKADPEFRRSIKEMGKPLRKQGQATDWEMLQTLEQAIEVGRASLDLDVAASPNQPAARPPEGIAATVPLFDGSFQAARAVPANQAEPTVPATAHRIQLVPRSLAEPAHQTQEEIPLALAEIASQFDQVLPESKPERDQSPPAAPSAPNSNEPSHQLAKPAPEKTTRLSLPRLSELRGMRFSQAIRDLDLAKHHASPSAGLEALMNAIAPFEPMFTRMEPASAKDDDPPETAHAESDLPASLRAFIPISESTVSSEAKNGVTAESTRAKVNYLHPGSFSPNPEPNVKSKERRGEEGEGSRPELKVANKKLSGPFEQLQILPSRRGQYKKKG
jgi:hypothetical protein